MTTTWNAHPAGDQADGARHDEARGPNGQTPSSDMPELSVLITTRDRSTLLKGCLESLDRQTAPLESYEIVVVVDGGSDDTIEMLATLQMRSTLTVVSQPASGSAVGRNTAAVSARGRILLFVDDDEIASPELVSAHLAAHRGRERTVVIGAIERRVPDDADRFAQLSVEDARWQIDGLSNRPATYWDCFGGNCSLTRVSFNEVGGFAVDLTRETDTEFGYRLHERGNGFLFASEAVVSEYRTRDWAGIVADAELRGRVALELYRRHPEMVTQMPLGGQGGFSPSRSAQAAAAFALALRLPPRLLAAAGFLVPTRRLRQAFASFTLNHAYWCGVRAAASPELWRSARSATLILGYHAFATEGEAASRYVVPGPRFAAQLRWLQRLGYNVITFGEYLDYRASHRFPPPRTVVITIDDGYRDTATVAGPLLEAHGCRATVFVLSAGGASNETVTDPALAARPLLDATGLRELQDGPFELGSHTRTHPRLSALAPEAAEAEIVGSKRELEQELGRPITLFAYPFGDNDQHVRALVAEAGFRGARGIQPGRNRLATDPFDLRSLEVCGTYSLPRFVTALLFGELRR